MRVCLLEENDVYFFGSSCRGHQMISIHNEIQVFLSQTSRNHNTIFKIVLGITNSQKDACGKKEQVFEYSGTRQATIRAHHWPTTYKRIQTRLKHTHHRTTIPPFTRPLVSHWATRDLGAVYSFGGPRARQVASCSYLL